MTNPKDLVRRRAFLYVLLTMPPAMILAACAQQQPANAPTAAPQPTHAPLAATSSPTVSPATQTPTQPATRVAQLLPTPACGDEDDDPTPAQTEGPYFTPGSPERASMLETGMQGTKLIVSGLVLSTDCKPIARALLDFWQCDDAGVYDNKGYRLRGHQFTDENGHYQLETILPGVYPGRTRHIHVKVQAPNKPVLTSQLYFPGEPRNRTDGIYNPVLEMTLADTADNGKQGAFDFVLQV